MAVSAALDLAPQQALDYFRAKGLRTTFSHRDLERDEHDVSFTVAKMADTELLADTRRAVERAIAEGQTFEDFRKGLQPRLEAAGWWGKQAVVDPLTGKQTLAQLGSPRRLETIFRINMQTAYAAGHWKQIEDNATTAPYLMYQAVDDERTRPEHHAWSGTVLPITDPWWKSHTPPCGYNCRCTLIQLGPRDLPRYGLTVATKAPPVDLVEVVNRRTGEITRTPRGVDPGFGYAPSARSPAEIAAKAFTSRVAGMPASIGAAGWQAGRKAALPGLEQSFSRFVADRGAQPTIAGVAAREDIAALVAAEIEPATAELAIDHATLDAAKLSLAESNAIPAGLNDPRAVYRDKETGTLIYALRTGRESHSNIAIEFEIGRADRPKQSLNLARRVFRSSLAALSDRRRYELIRGREL